MKTLFFAALLFTLVSCQKDEVTQLTLPKATVYVYSAVRGQGSTIAYFQTAQTGMNLVRQITFFYQAGTVNVPVVIDGRFSIVGHPATIIGYFQIDYKDGSIEKTESKNYL